VSTLVCTDSLRSGSPWPELNGADNSDSVFQRLQLLAQKGYKVVLIWPDLKGDDPDTLKLSGPAQQSLPKFAPGH